MNGYKMIFGPRNMSLPLHKFQLSLSTSPPPPLSSKQETMKFQKPDQVYATYPRVEKLFSGDNLGWTLIPWWTLINFWQNFPVWTLILGWTLINFDNKFQDERLFQRGRLLDREEYVHLFVFQDVTDRSVYKLLLMNDYCGHTCCIEVCPTTNPSRATYLVFFKYLKNIFFFIVLIFVVCLSCCLSLDISSLSLDISICFDI